MLQLVQRVRDEAHRFAIGFHRQTRTKRTLRSELDDIPGVGPIKRRKLLSRFGSLRGVRGASVEELATAVGRAAPRASAPGSTGRGPGGAALKCEGPAGAGPSPRLRLYVTWVGAARSRSPPWSGRPSSSTAKTRASPLRKMCASMSFGPGLARGVPPGVWVIFTLVPGA